jgi:hypothetical protein
MPHHPDFSVPLKAGAGFKPEHLTEILRDDVRVGFFEVHAENYMGAGGAPHAQLGRLRADSPVFVHGVGLSIPLSSEQVLVTRPQFSVRVNVVTKAVFSFFTSAVKGETLVEAADSASAVDDNFDLGAALALGLRLGCFSAVTVSGVQERHDSQF